MERKSIIICGVVGFLGLLSAVTGFAAEATRIKVIHFFSFKKKPKIPFFLLRGFLFYAILVCLWSREV